jgi:hypothetical protein
MSRRILISTVATLALTGGIAFADPDPNDPHVHEAADAPKGTYQSGDMEGEIYGGLFISNNRHQFYNVGDFSPNNTPTATEPVRPKLDRGDAEIGGRFAYFFKPWFGLEGEFSNIFAETVTGLYAPIYGLGLHAIFQRPSGDWTPYVSVGDSIRHVASAKNVLGNDTDFPIDASLGVKYWLTRTLAIRADARLMLGPAEGALPDPHYTLRAAYGEFTLGLTLKPRD